MPEIRDRRHSVMSGTPSHTHPTPEHAARAYAAQHGLVPRGGYLTTAYGKARGYSALAALLQERGLIVEREGGYLLVEPSDPVMEMISMVAHGSDDSAITQEQEGPESIADLRLELRAAAGRVETVLADVPELGAEVEAAAQEARRVVQQGELMLGEVSPHGTAKPSEEDLIADGEQTLTEDVVGDGDQIEQEQPLAELPDPGPLDGPMVRMLSARSVLTHRATAAHDRPAIPADHWPVLDVLQRAIRAGAVLEYREGTGYLLCLPGDGREVARGASLPELALLVRILRGSPPKNPRVQVHIKRELLEAWREVRNQAEGIGGFIRAGMRRELLHRQAQDAAEVLYEA